MRRAAPARPKRATPEADLQAAVMKEIGRRCGPDVFVFHVPNGGYRSAIEATNHLKRMGVVSGVPDLVVIIRGQAHFLELKAPGGSTSDTQKFTMRRIREAGAPIAVADSMDAALATLAGWGAFTKEARAA